MKIWCGSQKTDAGGRRWTKIFIPLALWLGLMCMHFRVGLSGKHSDFGLMILVDSLLFFKKFYIACVWKEFIFEVITSFENLTTQ